MERACVLLKDVFEYSLEEISELVGSTVGGVKSALKRGRMKLASTPEPAKKELGVSPEISKLLQLAHQVRILNEAQVCPAHYCSFVVSLNSCN